MVRRWIQRYEQIAYRCECESGDNSLIAGYLYESATFEETYIVKKTEYGHEIIKRINEENSDFENETGTDMIDVLEDDEIVIDDDKLNSCTLCSPEKALP